MPTLDKLEIMFPGYKQAVDDLKAGDKLEVQRGFTTAAGKAYYRGNVITLLEPTQQAPFGTVLEPHNWVVICPHWQPPAPQSVWSNIYLGVAIGLMKKV